MITSIEFQDKNYIYIDQDGEELSEICNLNKVNILVGPNNSGKSRFIRTILKENYIGGAQHTQPKGGVDNYNRKIAEIRSKLESIINQRSLLVPNVKQLTSQLANLAQIEKHESNVGILFKLKKEIEQIRSDKTIRKELRDIFKNELKSLSYEYYRYILFYNYNAVYVPMLRGLRPLIKLDIDKIGDRSTPYSDFNCFEERTIYDHFTEDSNKVLYIRETNKGMMPDSFTKTFKGQYKFDIFTGLDLYNEIKTLLLGVHEKRNFVKAYEKFLKFNFFDNRSVDLIPNIENDVLYIKVGDEEERPIYDLGDGLQTILMASFPLFKYKSEKLLLFIEEPELTLHPGMQRKLLSTYCNEFDNAQIFITTHSNHLLDLTLDFNNKCSIYSFERKSDEEFIIRNVTPNKEVLDLLGVRSSSVFLSNCVIWVEGISDRLYIRKFLELYNNSLGKDQVIFEEDKHYSIVEYGGDNIIHFNFFDPDSDGSTINVESVQKNNFIVADNDGLKYKSDIEENERKKIERLKELRKRLQDSFFAEHIEIENLIPFDVYKRYFENLEDIPQRRWKYEESKGTKNKFDSALDKSNIGDLIREHFIELKHKGRKTNTYYNKDISCIGQKRDIANKLIEIMDDDTFHFEDLPQTTKKLIHTIYAFIEENNSYE